MKQTISLVCSVVALVVATLGSTPLGEAARSAAAQVVPRNSVGPLQLKRNAVGPAKVAPNAIRTSHVLDGSLLTADFKAGQIPQGPKGDKGEKGDRGTAGATNVVVRRASVSGIGSATATANCNAGERAVGGGFDAGGWGTNSIGYRSYPVPSSDGATPTGWTAQSISSSGGASSGIVAYVICASP